MKIIRPSPDRKERREIIVDVDRMIRTGDTSANILIEPDDIIYVPPTPLAWVGLRIRELLFPVSPVLDAYVTPATVMDASDEYDDDENDTPGNTRRFGPRRY